jgi:DNA-binding transcriptional MerR regulator/methylmalonyl-CoA mutase cobalamin-binding subunit
MYTIRTAAARAGVSTEAVRAWERRYGVVSPKRGENGYRVYDDDAIARLVAMRRLIDAGWSAALAAQQVIEHGPSAEDAAATSRPAGSAGSARPQTDLVQEFVRAATAMDAAATEAVLDEMFARGTFERVSEDVVYPAMRALGEKWQTGELTVGAEHAASHAVARRLSAAFDAAGRPNAAGPRVVVGMPPGGRHEIGALGFAVAARRQGYAVTYLGADMPVDDWVRASANADVVVLGVMIKSDVAPALAVAKAVREAHPDVVVALGGAFAPSGAGHVRMTGSMVTALAALSNSLQA